MRIPESRKRLPQRCPLVHLKFDSFLLVISDESQRVYRSSPNASFSFDFFNQFLLFGWSASETFLWGIFWSYLHCSFRTRSSPIVLSSWFSELFTQISSPRSCAILEFWSSKWIFILSNPRHFKSNLEVRMAWTEFQNCREPAKRPVRPELDVQWMGSIQVVWRHQSGGDGN